MQELFQSAKHLYEKREGSGSGSVPLTNRSGSGRPKNMRILRIRIPNTDFFRPVLTYFCKQTKNDAGRYRMHWFLCKSVLRIWSRMFGASRIRIHEYEIRIQICILQAKIVRKTLIPLLCDFFMPFYLGKMM